jgi:hypothetical protein
MEMGQMDRSEGTGGHGMDEKVTISFTLSAEDAQYFKANEIMLDPFGQMWWIREQRQIEGSWSIVPERLDSDRG